MDEDNQPESLFRTGQAHRRDSGQERIPFEVRVHTICDREVPGGGAQRGNPGRGLRGAQAGAATEDGSIERARGKVSACLLIWFFLKHVLKEVREKHPAHQSIGAS